MDGRNEMLGTTGPEHPEHGPGIAVGRYAFARKQHMISTANGMFLCWADFQLEFLFRLTGTGLFKEFALLNPPNCLLQQFPPPQGQTEMQTMSEQKLVSATWQLQRSAAATCSAACAATVPLREN